MVQYIRHDGSSSLLLSGDLRIFIWMVKGQVLQRLLVISNCCTVIGNLCKNRPQNRDYEIWTRASKIISPDFFFLFRIDLSYDVNAYHRTSKKDQSNRYSICEVCAELREMRSKTDLCRGSSSSCTRQTETRKRFSLS